MNEPHCYKCACYMVCSVSSEINISLNNANMGGDIQKRVFAELAKNCIYFEMDSDQPRAALPVDNELGKWLSAALDDKNVCQEMKNAINNWFNSFSED